MLTTQIRTLCEAKICYTWWDFCSDSNIRTDYNFSMQTTLNSQNYSERAKAQGISQSREEKMRRKGMLVVLVWRVMRLKKPKGLCCSEYQEPWGKRSSYISRSSKESKFQILDWSKKDVDDVTAKWDMISTQLTKSGVLRADIQFFRETATI